MSLTLPAAQLGSAPLWVQEVKHAGTLGSHAKPPQSVTVPSSQPPLPLQKRVEVSSLALEHVVVAQTTDPSWKAHLPTLSHLPVIPQPTMPWSTHVPDGSLSPALTVEQVPSVVGMAQLSHWPQAAEPQHTPSTQWPVPHSLPPPHTLPTTFVATQLPPLQ